MAHLNKQTNTDQLPRRAKSSLFIFYKFTKNFEQSTMSVQTLYSVQKIIFLNEILESETVIFYFRLEKQKWNKLLTHSQKLSYFDCQMPTANLQYLVRLMGLGAPSCEAVKASSAFNNPTADTSCKQINKQTLSRLIKY